MQQPIVLKPQDIALLIKLLSKSNENWRQIDIAMEMKLSQGEVAKALARLNKANLVNDKRPNRSAALEFLLHGFRYAFPAELGPLSVGVPTALSSPAHEKMLVGHEDDVYVWPSSKGSKRGQIVVPLYPELAEAALNDKEFYDLMSAAEILRIGRAREKKLAAEYIEKRIKG